MRADEAFRCIEAIEGRAMLSLCLDGGDGSRKQYLLNLLALYADRSADEGSLDILPLFDHLRDLALHMGDVLFEMFCMGVELGLLGESILRGKARFADWRQKSEDLCVRYVGLSLVNGIYSVQGSFAPPVDKLSELLIDELVPGGRRVQAENAASVAMAFVCREVCVLSGLLVFVDMAASAYSSDPIDLPKGNGWVEVSEHNLTQALMLCDKMDERESGACDRQRLYCLYAQGMLFDTTGRPEEGQATYSAALGLCRELSTREPQVYLPLLPRLLELCEGPDDNEARAAALREGVAIWDRVACYHPGLASVYAAGYAEELVSVLLRLGCFDEAQDAMRRIEGMSGVKDIVPMQHDILMGLWLRVEGRLGEAGRLMGPVLDDLQAGGDARDLYDVVLTPALEVASELEKRDNPEALWICDLALEVAERARLRVQQEPEVETPFVSDVLGTEERIERIITSLEMIRPHFALQADA